MARKGSYRRIMRQHELPDGEVELRPALVPGRPERGDPIKRVARRAVELANRGRLTDRDRGADKGPPPKPNHKPAPGDRVNPGDRFTPHARKDQP